MDKCLIVFKLSLLSILAIGLNHTSPAFAKKGGEGGGGGGGGKPGGEDPPAVTSCAEKTSEFPAFAYVETINSRKGSNSDIYLSNADGDCAILVHSTDTEANNLSYALNGNEAVIAWVENIDNSYRTRDPRYRQDTIKVLRVQTSNKAISSTGSVDSVLISGDESLIYSDMDMSEDGNFIVFSYDYISVSGSMSQDIREVEISSCPTDCSDSLLYSATSEEVITSVTYNSSANRIYFTGSMSPNSSGPYAGFNLISFIEDQGGIFSSAVVLAAENSGDYGNDFSARGVLNSADAGSAYLGSDLVEAVAYRFHNVSTGKDEVHIIDAGICSVTSPGDCLANGKSSIEVMIEDGDLPSLSSDSLLFSSSVDDSLYRYDFVSRQLSLVGSGTQADQ